MVLSPAANLLASANRLAGVNSGVPVLLLEFSAVPLLAGVAVKG
jgi:hypothetical protein